VLLANSAHLSRHNITANRFVLRLIHQQLISHLPGSGPILEALVQYRDEELFVGSTTALIPEAADASVFNFPVEDGMSGDTDFPFGNLKPLATVGEISGCVESAGEMVVGVPDGMCLVLVPIFYANAFVII